MPYIFSITVHLEIRKLKLRLRTGERAQQAKELAALIEVSGWFPEHT